MNRFVDEEIHMWKDFEFCITDDDIEKLKQGKTLNGDVNDEFAVILKYKADNKNKQGLAYADQDTLMSAT